MLMLKLILINILLMFISGFPQKAKSENKFAYNEKSLRTVLEEIRTQKNVNFIYSDKLVENIKINMNAKEVPVENILNDIFDQHNLSYKKVEEKAYVLFRKEKPDIRKPKAEIITQNIKRADSSNIISEPILITKTQLIYPLEALLNNVEGDVIVNMFINKNGDVSKTRINSTSGSAILDSAAARYSYNLKFTPAYKNGKPGVIWVSMKYRYSIVDKAH
jgi:TonB family protein